MKVAERGMNNSDEEFWVMYMYIHEKLHYVQASRRYRWTQGNAANDSLTQGTIDRAAKEFFKWLNACVVAKGGHFYYPY